MSSERLWKVLWPVAIDGDTYRVVSHLSREELGQSNSLPIPPILVRDNGLAELVAKQLNETHTANALESRITQLEADLAEARTWAMSYFKCKECQGSGEPQCITCYDYQRCICKPGEGRYAEHCWLCNGSGMRLLPANFPEALSRLTPSPESSEVGQ